jgi:hypothetical protein
MRNSQQEKAERARVDHLEFPPSYFEQAKYLVLADKFLSMKPESSCVLNWPLIQRDRLAAENAFDIVIHRFLAKKQRCALPARAISGRNFASFTRMRTPSSSF